MRHIYSYAKHHNSASILQPEFNSSVRNYMEKQTKVRYTSQVNTKKLGTPPPASKIFRKKGYRQIIKTPSQPPKNYQS